MKMFHLTSITYGSYLICCGSIFQLFGFIFCSDFYSFMALLLFDSGRLVLLVISRCQTAVGQKVNARAKQVGSHLDT